ncbi:hypothetical protein IW140_002234 [Coemansia sp. RSA 1813]|nr:hypothetical protein EV178_001742 [Coemansia sp. RSA 1646]KAJ1770518.1 hypothetical protein LPJ74_003122 [Coemansia sp. RSA 1843]KAJ2092945.1 hypothetical protein IW138_000658 [Coemansia sp. RSA 986]KAJ2216266.1 hypothetical protein EV179_001504 [Coemansia sp. RSA 487]KAJ2570562.1 hypothetical protein IW140_002234 [Coemansia sp. RSA 1813]
MDTFNTKASTPSSAPASSLPSAPTLGLAPSPAYPITQPTNIPQPPARRQHQQQRHQEQDTFRQIQTRMGGKTLTNPASRALLGRQGIHKPAAAKEGSRLPAKSKMPHHMCMGLASPTDSIMSPATRGVKNLRHKKISRNLSPQVLGSLFESMKQDNKQGVGDHK